MNCELIIMTKLARVYRPVLLSAVFLEKMGELGLGGQKKAAILLQGRFFRGNIQLLFDIVIHSLGED